MKLPRRRSSRPRFNGSPSDHAPTEQWLSQLRTDDVDGTTWPAEPGHVTFGGVSDIGVMAIAIGPAPLAGYRPEPAALPALPAVPEPEPERPVLAEVDPLTETAVIGNQLRLPIIWCEMPRCISWHQDPDSLGERDTRRRAIARGWRTDALGRLACPPCQQTRPDYDSPQPVAWHHPEVARHWRERGTVLREQDTFRLGVEAELGRRVSHESPSLARAIAGATHRTGM